MVFTCVLLYKNISLNFHNRSTTIGPMTDTERRRKAEKPIRATTSGLLNELDITFTLYSGREQTALLRLEDGTHRLRPNRTPGNHRTAAFDL